MNVLRLAASIATMLVLCSGTWSSAGRDRFTPVDSLAQEAPVFSARSELVVLDVLVRDRKNAYVAGLARDSFTVEEDGVRQTIQFFAESGVPATVGLLIDSSGSMTSAEEAVIAAVVTFAETSNPDDQIFALTFNDRVRSVLPPAISFTGDAQMLREALTDAFRPWGRTALYDAIAAGFDHLGQGTRQRKALILVSDGGDNASRTPLDRVVEKVEASNTVIHTVALTDHIEGDTNPKILERLAEMSGGTSFQPGRRSQVRNALRLIAHDIRNSYTIGYVSTNTALDGRLRRIQVMAEAPGRRDLRVRTRQGYVAR